MGNLLMNFDEKSSENTCRSVSALSCKTKKRSKEPFFFDSSACSACNDRWWLLRFVAQDGRFRDPVLVYRSGNGLAVDCFEENYFCGS